MIKVIENDKQTLADSNVHSSTYKKQATLAVLTYIIISGIKLFRNRAFFNIEETHVA